MYGAGDPGRGRVGAAARTFGRPQVARRVQEVLPWELDLIETVCGDRRHHDVTVFALRGEALAMVHKPSDAAGVWWVPAGGVGAHETLEQAAERETWEEAGVRVRIVRYVLRAHVLFRSGARERLWTSHVMAAEWVSGDPAPIDMREVEAASWVDARAFATDVAPLMRADGQGRYAYRLWMAGLVFAELGLPGGADVPARIQCSDRRG